jgi:hypothetical protein
MYSLHVSSMTPIFSHGIVKKASSWAAPEPPKRSSQDVSRDASHKLKKRTELDLNSSLPKETGWLKEVVKDLSVASVSQILTKFSSLLYAHLILSLLCSGIVEIRSSRSLTDFTTGKEGIEVLGA